MNLGSLLHIDCRMVCCSLTLLAACTVGAQSIDQLEQAALYDAASKAAPCVVRIETIGGLEKVGQVLVSMGPTSGVVVHEDGYIVSSAFSFVQKPNSILVQLPNGERTAAKIVSRDHSRRLVLLKVEVDEPLPVAEPAAKSEIEVGQWAVTVGRVLPNANFNMSVGIVSAKNRIWGTAIQTDANVSPANYGGALVNLHGRVMGVLTPLSPDSNKVVAGAEWYDSGIGFAIPLEDILSNLDRFRSGDIYAGKLGVAIKGTDMYGDKPIVGVCRPKSPAREAGIRSGDLILRINDEPVRTHVELKHVLGPLLAGDLVDIDFQRDGETLSKTVELTDKLVPYEHPFVGILPVRNARLEVAGGVRIRYVYEGSPAANAGLKADDVLLALNEQPTVAADELRDAIASFEPGDNVIFRYMSDGEERSAKLELAAMTESVPAALPDAFPERETLDEQLPPLGKINVKLPEEEGDCAAYIPESYDPRFEHSLIVLLPVPGKENADDLVVQWRSACNDARAILLLPQAKEARSWLPTETAFIRKTIENVRKEYVVDPERIAVMGGDNSGAMAYLTAFTHRDLIRGVAALRAPVPANSPLLINEPLQRLAAFVGVPREGRMSQRIKSNVAQLRAARIPVTQKEVTSSEIDDKLRVELIRWVDTLDRI